MLLLHHVTSLLRHVTSLLHHVNHCYITYIMLHHLHHVTSLTSLHHVTSLLHHSYITYIMLHHCYITYIMLHHLHHLHHVTSLLHYCYITVTSLLHHCYILVTSPVDSPGSGGSKSEEVSSCEEQSVLWAIARVSSVVCNRNNIRLEVIGLFARLREILGNSQLRSLPMRCFSSPLAASYCTSSACWCSWPETFSLIFTRTSKSSFPSLSPSVTCRMLTSSRCVCVCVCVRGSRGN